MPAGIFDNYTYNFDVNGVKVSLNSKQLKSKMHKFRLLSEVSQATMEKRLIFEGKSDGEEQKWERGSGYTTSEMQYYKNVQQLDRHASRRDMTLKNADAWQLSSGRGAAHLHVL